MTKKFYHIIAVILAVVLAFPASVFASGGASHGHEEEGLDVKTIIFEHLGDGYGWEVPFNHAYRIPLPVIVKAEDGQWFCFSSGSLTEVIVTEDEASGKKEKHLVPVVRKIERDGKTYEFVIAKVSEHKDKVVQIFPLSAQEEAAVKTKADSIAVASHIDASKAVVPGYVNFDGSYYREYRTFDISITKNVLALFICAVLVTLMVMSVVRHYAKKGMRAPRKGMGFMEMCLVRKSVDRQIQHFLVKCVKKTKNSGTNLRFRQSMPGTAAEKVSVRLTRNTILRSGHCLQ